MECHYDIMLSIVVPNVVMPSVSIAEGAEGYILMGQA